MCFPKYFAGLQHISALKGNGFAAAAGERAEGVRVGFLVGRGTCSTGGYLSSKQLLHCANQVWM